MGENSKIEWCDHTFNPWIGCQRVSPGCVNCYAEAQDARWGRSRWGPNAPRERTSPSYWLAPLKWNADAEKSRSRARVFCASFADVFEDRDDLIAFRRDLFALVDETPWLDWLFLTKRPQNVRAMLPWGWLAAMDRGVRAPNVWFGCTIEDQQRADERIPELLKIPAVVRFLSVEPLLQRVNLNLSRGIDWVIVGGESGRKARPFEISWATDVALQAKAARVKVFVKQLGSAPFDGSRAVRLVKPDGSIDHKGADMSLWPARVPRLREFPVVRP